MLGVDGNLTAELQIRTTVKNKIGEKEPYWMTVQTLTGWLDFMSGETRYTTYNSKIEESSHIWVGEYEPIDPRVTAENSRLVINGNAYDIVLMDNPMMLNYQWEIYLRFTGGAN